MPDVLCGKPRMNHLEINMKRIVTKLGAAVAVGILSNLAAAQDVGVKCGGGFSADFNSDKVLRCVKKETLTRTSICPPITHPNYTQMEAAGSDTCKPQVVAQAGISQPSAMLLLPGDPAASAFKRNVVQNGADNFTAEKTTYAFPEGIGGLAVFIGDASRGVKCANIDSNDVVSFSGGVLKCQDVKVSERKSHCSLPGWTLSVESGEDRCINPVGGRDATVPDGELNASGWTLQVNHDGNRDYWKKTTRKYEWPVVR